MKRALIVDDAATVRLYHREILEKAGFVVEEAINGLEALEKAVAARYDLYLVDVNMPRMDGYAFLRRLRACDEVFQAPAVMISTESEEKDRMAAYAAGANYYVSKPIRPDSLARLAALLTGTSAS
jgi:two-component system chemotaxis response regulator CheY